MVTNLRLIQLLDTIARGADKSNWNDLYLETLLKDSITPGYVHTQSSPSTTWVINHGLGTKTINYIVTNGGGVASLVGLAEPYVIGPLNNLLAIQVVSEGVTLAEVELILTAPYPTTAAEAVAQLNPQIPTNYDLEFFDDAGSLGIRTFTTGTGTALIFHNHVGLPEQGIIEGCYNTLFDTTGWVYPYEVHGTSEVQIVPADLELYDRETCIARFSNPEAGKAYILFGNAGWTNPLQGPVGASVPPLATWDDGVSHIVDSDPLIDVLSKMEFALSLMFPKPNDLNNAVLTPSISFYSGRVSAGNTLFSLSPGDLISTITPTNIFTFTTQFYPEKGLLLLHKNGLQIDSLDLLAFFDENRRYTGQTSVPWLSLNGYFSVTACVPENHVPNYQKLTVVVNALPILSAGEDTIRLIRDTQSKAISFFFDMEPAAVIAAPVISEVTPVLKNLCGVPFYRETSELRVQATITGLYANTYLDTPVEAQFGPDIVLPWTLIDVGVIGVPDRADSLVLDKTFSFPFTDKRFLDAPSVRAVKTCNRVTASALPTTVLLDFYTATVNSDTLEQFFDNEYRLPAGPYEALPPSPTGQWDDDALLTNGNALTLAGRLQYPNRDFSTNCLPVGPDYSTGFTGNQLYFRAFLSTSPQGSGTLKVSGVTGTQLLDKDILIHIKIPSIAGPSGVSGWLSLNDWFNYPTFAGVDGDGILTGVNGDEFSFTLSHLSTGNNNSNLVVVRITLLDGTVEPTRLEMLGW